MTAAQRAPAEGYRELRDAYGCFATGVAVATCTGPSGSAVAVTINSFVSISLQPPIVSFALGQHSRSLEAFLADARFTIHVLEESQRDVATNFARPATSSWSGIGHSTVDPGHVVFERYAAVFLCRRLNERRIGDHVVLDGEVTRFEGDLKAAPLAFCHGRYGTLRLSGPPHAFGDREALPDRDALWSWG